MFSKGIVTHQALLINIEPLPDPCDHPEYAIISRRGNDNITEHTCWKCYALVVPTKYETKNDPQ